jgi:hypothetical protein
MKDVIAQAKAAQLKAFADLAVIYFRTPAPERGDFIARVGESLGHWFIIDWLRWLEDAGGEHEAVH